MLRDVFFWTEVTFLLLPWRLRSRDGGFCSPQRVNGVDWRITCTQHWTLLYARAIRTTKVKFCNMCAYLRVCNIRLYWAEAYKNSALQRTDNPTEGNVADKPLSTWLFLQMSADCLSMWPVPSLWCPEECRQNVAAGDDWFCQFTPSVPFINSFHPVFAAAVHLCFV